MNIGIPILFVLNSSVKVLIMKKFVWNYFGFIFHLFQLILIECYRFFRIDPTRFQCDQYGEDSKCQNYLYDHSNLL